MVIQLKTFINISKASNIDVDPMNLFWWIFQVCRQVYYNRKWSDRGETRPLEEEEASRPERVARHDAHHDAHSVKTLESDFHSTVGEYSSW